MKPNAYDLFTATAELMASHPQRYNQNTFCGTQFCRAGFMFVAAGGDWADVSKKQLGSDQLLFGEHIYEPVEALLDRGSESDDFSVALDKLFDAVPYSECHDTRAGIKGLLAFRDQWADRLRATLYTPLNEQGAPDAPDTTAAP